MAEHSQVRIEGFARMFGYKRDTVNKWLRGYNHISGEAKRKLEIFFDTGVAVKRPEPEPTGNDLIDRIKMFIWKHNMDNAEFYTACGIPKATYDNWMSGRNATCSIELRIVHVMLPDEHLYPIYQIIPGRFWFRPLDSHTRIEEYL